MELFKKLFSTLNQNSVRYIGELIKMKEKTDRTQDKADIYYLKKIMGEWKDEK